MVETKTTDIRRQTAYKCSIRDLTNGVFVKKEGWESNYVMTDYGDFSRVNVIGVIVSKENSNFILDDGTGTMSCRMFEQNVALEGLAVGDVVLTIARPREYNGQLYLASEIVRKIDNPAWIAYRKKELLLLKKVRNVQELRGPAAKEPVLVESSSTTSSKERILKLISEIDDGSGASIDDVVRLSKIRNAEEIITDLLLKGEIFEIKAGRVKMMN